MKSIACAALALLANGQQPAVDPAMLPPIVPADPRMLVCSSTECAGRVVEITPAENYVLECLMPNGCAGTQIYINVGYDPNRPTRAVQNLEEIIFQEVGSGEGASIHISNTLFATGHRVELGEVICEKAGSCTGLTIYAGEGVEFLPRNVDCVAPGSCVGCTVHSAGTIQPCGINALAQQPVAPPQFPGAVPPGFEQPAAPAAPGQAVEPVAPPQFPGAVPPGFQQPQQPVDPVPVAPVMPVYPVDPVPAQPANPVPPVMPVYPAAPQYVAPAPANPVEPAPVNPNPVYPPQPPAQGFPQFPGAVPPNMV